MVVNKVRQVAALDIQDFMRCRLALHGYNAKLQNGPFVIIVGALICDVRLSMHCWSCCMCDLRQAASSALKRYGASCAASKHVVLLLVGGACAGQACTTASASVREFT